MDQSLKYISLISKISLRNARLMTQVDDIINFANIRNSDGRETSGRTIKGEVGLHDLAIKIIIY